MSALGSGGTSAARSEAAPAISRIDPDASPQPGIRLLPYLTFGGQGEFEYVLTKHANLQSGGADDLSTIEPELSLALSLDPSRYVQVFVEVKLVGEFNHSPEEQEQSDVGLELAEAFLLFKHLWDGRLALQVGRQKFEDSRQWLYDEELDAVRAFYHFARGSLELAVIREGLVSKDIVRHRSTEQRNTYLVYGTYMLRQTIGLAAYVFWRDDRSQAHESPVFFGLHSHGDLIENLHYWCEFAHVRGQDGSQTLRGFGVDLGGTYAFTLPFEPSVTLGYAFGTGDGDRDDGTDTRFRQTGLEGNEGKFNGVASFQYYGELFDPELSNLAILTAGIGVKPSPKSSVDLLYHDYRQHTAADTLRAGRLHATPEGRHTHLGREVDLIMGYKEIKSVDLALVLGYFLPGKAFSTTSTNSFFFRFKMQVEF